MASLCLAQGCVWAEVLGQGETLALIPNIMDNHMAMHQREVQTKCRERE